MEGHFSTYQSIRVNNSPVAIMMPLNVVPGTPTMKINILFFFFKNFFKQEIQGTVVSGLVNSAAQQGSRLSASCTIWLLGWFRVVCRFKLYNIFTGSGFSIKSLFKSEETFSQRPQPNSLMSPLLKLKHMPTPELVSAQRMGLVQSITTCSGFHPELQKVSPSLEWWLLGQNQGRYF